MSATVVFPNFSATRERRPGPLFLCTLHASRVGPTWVHVAGDLDITSAPQLEQALRHMDWWRLVILDLRELSLLDASVVDVIVRASQRARRVQGRLMLIRMPGQFDRVLALADGAAALEFYDLDPLAPQTRVFATRADG